MINKSRNILSWIESAIAKHDFVTAVHLVKQTAPDCERIYVLLMLVEAEKDGKARTRKLDRQHSKQQLFGGWG